MLNFSLRKIVISLNELLKSNGATAVLSGFIALSGFYVTHVVEELRSGRTATYHFGSNHETGTSYFYLSNISRRYAIKGARIIIKCSDQRNNCFDPLIGKNGQLVFVREVSKPPIFARPIQGNQSAASLIQICLSVIPSSTARIEFSTPEAHKNDLMAMYDPWYKGCEDNDTKDASLLLLNRFDMHALVARYYFNIVAVILLFFVVLLAWAGANIAYKQNSNSP